MSSAFDKDPSDWPDSDWRSARSAAAREPAPSGAREWTDAEIADAYRHAQRQAAEVERLRERNQKIAEANRAAHAELDRQEAELMRRSEEVERRSQSMQAESARRNATISSLPDITGCRLVAGANPRNGAIGNVTIRFANPAFVAILIGRACERLDWDDIESIAVQALPDRNRVTAPRAVGLGVFSLAAKKRKSWCVMKLVWGTRHLVFEVPREAYRLHGELATAGVWRLV
jgi:hypothetical protein